MIVIRVIRIIRVNSWIMKIRHQLTALNLSIVLTAVVLLTGCIGRQAYYVSPLNGLNNPYRSVPLNSDSVKSSTYVGGVFSAGSANDGESDKKYSFLGSISRGNNFGKFQARYGASITAGSYKMAHFDSVGNHSTVNYSVINQNAGTYFFGGAGMDFGINFVLSGKKSEWRLIGGEASIHHEFGDYFKARNRIPDSAATLVIREKLFATAGLFTEFVGKAGNTQIGGKLGWGTAIGHRYHPNFTDGFFQQHPISFGYFNFAFHITYGQWTGYMQGNMADKSNNMLFGLNYRLGK